MTPAIVMMPKGLRYAALSLACGAALMTACSGDDDDAAATPTPAGNDVATSSPPAASTSLPGARATASATDAGAAQPVTPVGGVDPTTVAELGGDIAGGDPDAPRQAVSDVPTPPVGASPSVDSTEVALASAETSEMKFIVDMDAARSGVQAVRSVRAGDVFRVAVVMANIPAGTSMAAFNFYLDYDRTKIVAPSYAGGPSTDRNPDLDEGSLGGGWLCIPAPEGDVDDPGGTEGDGDPATGRALISCFNAEGGPSGSVVLAVVEFHAVAAGAVTLSLSNVSASDFSGVPLAQCPGDAGSGAVVPCDAGSVTVQ